MMGKRNQKVSSLDSPTAKTFLMRTNININVRFLNITKSYGYSNTVYYSVCKALLMMKHYQYFSDILGLASYKTFVVYSAQTI